MPCESCNIQFTVFRRKRTCADCKRFYCNNCLTSKRSNTAPLCERCAIFAKRPLLRADLQQLKPKDLIFYLQSKHISTTGCVEKDELIGLVLNHVQQTDNESNSSHANSNNNNSSYFPFEADTKNSFEGVKQSCQNFFINITDNISEKFNAYDGKSKTNRCSPAAHSTDSSTHILNQPRVSTRQIPTYASYQTNQQMTAQLISNNMEGALPSNEYQRNGEDRPSSSSSSAPRTQSKRSRKTSPIASPSSSATSHLPQIAPSRSNESNSIQVPLPGNIDNTQQDNTLESSDCDCSEEELYQTFYGQSKSRMDNNVQEILVNPCPSTSNAGLSIDKIESHGSKIDIAYDIGSSQSSFEELGAIGGISDDSKAATDTNSSNMEQWQILDMQRLEPNGRTEEEGIINSYVNTDRDLNRRNMDELPQNSVQATATYSTAQPENSKKPVPPQRTKKVLRRRSESYLRHHGSRDNEDESPPITMQQFPQIREALLVDRSHSHCSRCGKSNINIKRHVEKMRRYLENVQMPEEDIINELKKFLTYMENRTNSVDCSDSEAPLSPMSSNTHTLADGSMRQATNVNTIQHEEMEADDENDGIHVYAGSSEEFTKDSRFIKLEEYNSLEELESLNVKQLKEVLMLNRVDYKGCCEKQELLDRVQRLWNNLQSTPGANPVDKLQTDELCKICMDAPIECVILECGHMATCTNCGKVLNECPICRQYIVRVVRFFRA